MDIDLLYWSKISAVALLVPGLLFLFIVVFYIAFLGKSSAATAPPNLVCLKCGHTLLPDETKCSECGTDQAADSEKPNPLEGSADSPEPLAEPADSPPQS